MIRLERMRHLAMASAAAAVQEHLCRGDRRARFELAAVQTIATTAALIALRDYITQNAISDVGEITAMLSPNPNPEIRDLVRQIGA